MMAFITCRCHDSVIESGSTVKQDLINIADCNDHICLPHEVDARYGD
jgi:hypothetical protein